MVLEGQVRRMLADPRSRALVDNFFGQWLSLRRLREATPDPDMFSDFDGNLREAFERETELFVESHIRENRRLPELLTANETFVNERLARHYGIPNIYGSHFRRVTMSRPRARWSPRPRQHLDHHVVSHTHLAGGTGALAARHVSRDAPAAATARHPCVA